VTLRPGYIWVGNPKNFHFKRAEHGGFSDPDTHIALIVGGGALSEGVEGTTVDTPVQTRQIAVTVLNSLGLSAAKLQGAVIDGTKGLPDLGIPQDNVAQFTEGKASQALVGAFVVPNTSGSLDDYTVVVHWGDGKGATEHPVLVRDQTRPDVVDVYAVHTYAKEGTYHGTVDVTGPDGKTATTTFTAIVVEAPKDSGHTPDDQGNGAPDSQTPAATDDAATAAGADPSATTPPGQADGANGSHRAAHKHVKHHAKVQKASTKAAKRS
jgi:hypothetical protein